MGLKVAKPQISAKWREGKNAASLKQIRAALSFAYKHWDLKNPFAKIEPPLHKEPQIRYLLLSDIRRLLETIWGTRRMATAPPSRSTWPQGGNPVMSR